MKEISPELAKKLAAEQSRLHLVGRDDVVSNLTVGEVVELSSAYQDAAAHLGYQTRRADKAERREAQFRTWWTGVKQELDQLKRSLSAEVDPS